MIQVTQQQRDNALDALNNMWPSVPPENVYPGLNAWVRDAGQPNCGTVACFGGWCAWWPAFRDQGVVASASSGAPTILGRHFGVASDLFGNYDLFHPRGEHEADMGFEGNDHELVTHRLKWLIENSEVVAS